MRRLYNRRLLGWLLFAVLLVALAWGLHLLLPPEPRWVLRGPYGAGAITPDGTMYITRTAQGMPLPLLTDMLATEPLVDPVQVGPVQYWDIATGQEVAQVLGERGSVWHVAFSRNCKQLAAVAPLTGDPSRQELCWIDLTAGSERRTDFMRRAASWQPWISPNATLLLLEDWNDPPQGIYLFETASLREIARASGADGRRIPWKWSADGNALYYYEPNTHGDSSLRRIGVDGQTTIVLKGADDWLALSPDDRTLFTWPSNADDDLILWDLPAGTRRAAIRLDALNAISHRVFFTPDSRSLVITSGKAEAGDAVGVWDVAGGKWLVRLPFVGSDPPLFAGPHAVVLHEDEGRIVWHQLRPVARRWQHEGKKLRAIEYLAHAERLVVVSGDGSDVDVQGRFVESGDQGGDRLLLLDAQTGEPTLDVALEPRAGHSWAAKGEHFVVITVHERGGERGMVREFVEDHLLSFFVPTMQFGSDRGTSVRVFDIASGTDRYRINLPNAEIDAEAITPDGKTLILHQVAMMPDESAVICYDLPPRRSWGLILGILSALGVMVLLVKVASRRMWRRASMTARNNATANSGSDGAVP
jgi:hypothetical protein